MANPDVDSGPVEPLAVNRWHVYNACHVLVATYASQAAADAHVASWPALYVSLGAPSGLTASPGGHDSLPGKHTRTKSDG